ncbi:dephospho-CoA kinase [Celerinatantimonas sp. YJH-8]|uniref:dephospho-CoA kinase n=1 Tax=Celerinatantimonas sp. YJH-8 TaxID=3228714 RepID=UPI0038CC1547
MIVAITGGIASGKSTVADLIARQGIDCVDADIVARELVTPGGEALQEIQHHFGSSIIDEKGTLNRKKLRELVFASPKQRIWLEHCLHPRIQKEIERQLKAATSDYTLMVVPLLVGSPLQTLADRILVVDMPIRIQISRVCQRDQINEELARQIIASQASREQRIVIADDILVNDDSLQSLQAKALKLHRKYLHLAKSDDSPGRTL